jgi:transposase
VVRRAIARERFERWCVENLPAGCVVAMEACSGAHHWGRTLARLGFTPMLIPPHLVAPLRIAGARGKNDANDAAAIYEASLRPAIHAVAVKTLPQQAMLLAHSLRAGAVEERTAWANRIRGALAEYGIVVPQGIEQLRRALPMILDRADQGIPDLARRLLGTALQHWAALDAVIEQAEQPIAEHAREDPRARVIAKLHGIGPIGASAVVAHVGDAGEFKAARQLPAWMGVVPSQNSSGGKTRLGGITKHGQPGLRTLLVTGARSAVQTAHLRDDRISRWLTDLRERAGWQKACVALVNKNLRIIWAILNRGECFDPNHVPQMPSAKTKKLAASAA